MVTEAELDIARQAITTALEAGSIDSVAAEAAGKLLDLARERVVRRQSLEQLRDEFQRKTDDAPAALEAIRAQLARPSATPTPQVPEDASLAQLEQRSSEVDAELEAARRAVPELAAEAATRAERTTAIATELASLRPQITELQNSVSGPPPAVDTAPRPFAQRLLDVATLQSLNAQRTLLQAEAASYEARAELLPARRAAAQRRIQELESLATAWRSVVSEKAAAEARQAEQEARAARERAALSHPVLQAFAEETQTLTTLRTGPERLTLRTELARQRFDERSARITAMVREFRSIRERLDASGLNRATGVLLRRQFDQLEDAGDLRRRVRSIGDVSEQIALQLIEYRDGVNQYVDTAQTTERLLAEIQTQETSTTEDLDQYRDVAQQLATARYEVLNALARDAEAFSSALVDLEIVTRGLLEGTQAFESFIRERILWIRSIPANRPVTASDLATATKWSLDPVTWMTTARTTGRWVRTNWIQTAGWVLVIGGLFAVNHRARRRLRQRGKEVASYRTDSFMRSIEVLGLTIVLALPVPLVLSVVGWILGRPTDQTSLGVALGAGLRGTALLLLPYLFTLQVLRVGGLAEAHFRWMPTAIKASRRHLRWFIAAASPLIVITIAINVDANDAIQATVGRTAFTAAMVLMSILAQRLLRPGGPVLREWLRRHPNSWLDRLKWFWYPLLIVLPLAFAIVAWSGWYYTALELQDRLQRTTVLLMVLVVANGFLLRWLFIARRQVAIDEARRRREQSLSEARSRAEKDADEGEQPQEVTVPAINEDALDLPSISAQTRQLFRTAIVLTLVAGLYLIWVDVAPALRIFDRIQVLPRVAMLEESEDVRLPILLDAQAAINLASRDGVASPAAAPAPAPGAASPPAANGGSNGGPSPGGSTLPGMPAAAPADAATTDASVPYSLTLADIGLSLVAGILTLVAVRNLPGLVEIAILQRLPLDTAARYALSTVLRYLIVVLGLIIASGAIGVTWSKLQWLAAALTFGLAFGLQEIFANFISGLIILAERPVRVGDTVTVGGVSGVVTRIRMRATTITDWDRKELIIPNKTFITCDVINWTLSDPVLRVMIPVGVGYGEDVDQARKLLLQVAKKHDLVLADPAPQALFLGFGDSTLNFELRVFIPRIDCMLGVRNDMHFAILKAFREAGIEIAFPQRDLHLRSIGDLSQFLTKREDLSPAELAGDT
jgi:potassium efflux system protein